MRRVTGEIMQLLSFEDLMASGVVANCRMNRERQLSGSNGYDYDLNFDILSFLGKATQPAAWMDLCCGTGRALIEAAFRLDQECSQNLSTIEGIDLAGMFDPNPFPGRLTLSEASIEAWTPARSYSLITCVHGLHYVGDKLAAIRKAVEQLSPEGLFLAHLDLINFRQADGRPAGRMIASRLKANGLEYSSRRRLVTCRGPKKIDWNLHYLGADDTAGPNSTGQSAVDAYYALG